MPWVLGTKIAEVIPVQGADYLLALKDNQRSLAGATALWFGGPEAATLPVHETTDADHGRIETRRHRVSHDAGWLQSPRSTAGEPRFPGLKAVAMVEAQVERDGKTTLTRRFLLSSLAPGSAPPRPRRPRPLGDRKPPALGAGCASSGKRFTGSFSDPRQSTTT